ncbi:MAG: hypothetical protein ACTSXO_08360 [Candidatus Heimdallarchaeota archaeon]|nr:MAG: hypothetical protein DRO63_04420 [Candidatus Gerdarchaeota archaeon]RLI69523.1 MAG: hypothetical protein DRP02_10380 [Candidatus Gerdarchaeota archaeon]RLI74010.1 MAG: hypothetical protein DRO91_01640 [Candidatus Heimdallarchaeota archaeon]
MDIRTISSHNYIPVIDPEYLKQSPDEFLAEHGGFLSEVALVAKSTSGFVHYRSATAPAHRDTNEFFSTFSSIADSIGIKVYAFVNALADSFLAKNPGYSAIKDGGNPNTDFIDPFKTSYINYLNSIIEETISFPVQGIVLDNLRFPHEDYSFCETCCRKFSEAFGIERIFSLNDLHKDPNLYTQWIQWRVNAIETILKEIKASVSKKRKVELSIVLDIDPTIEGAKGALVQFGQNIDVFGRYGLPTIHLSAWTPFPSSINSPEYKTLIRTLKVAKDYQAKTQSPLNLYLWGLENEASIEIVEAINNEISLSNIFIQNYLPADYQKRREIHLGLG